MQTSVNASPNVTPLVDVMLVLLIIFMVVTPTLLDGFLAEPPNAVNVRERPNDSTETTLGIDAAGRYYLNKVPVSAADLSSRLDAIYGTQQLNRVLFIKAHRELQYSAILAAIDTARNHGVAMIGMITQEKQPSVRRP
jgi:biopolymer transport protein TolR